MELLSFYRLFQRHGGYSLPVLVEISDGKEPETVKYLTNDIRDVTDEAGQVYTAATMRYTPPSMADGVPFGGTLEIALENDDMLHWLDESDDRLTVRVAGVLYENDTVQRLSSIVHQFGSVSWDGEKITWQLGVDDRLHMQINPWVLDADALTGVGVN